MHYFNKKTSCDPIHHQKDMTVISIERQRYTRHSTNMNRIFQTNLPRLFESEIIKNRNRDYFGQCYLSNTCLSSVLQTCQMKVPD